MISWIITALLAYFFFGLSSFGDKLVLLHVKQGPPSGEKVSNAKLYTFYAGLFNVFAILLIPFISFGWPQPQSIPWIILDAIAFLVGIYTIFSAMEQFEVSKVVPAIGSLQPLLVFVFTFVFFGHQVLSTQDLLAFVILLVGGTVISMENGLSIHPKYLFLVILSALAFSLDYIFVKMIFLNEPFLQGMIWIRICAAIFTLLLLFVPTIRHHIFSKGKTTVKSGGPYFIFAQGAGALGILLQSFTIALTPIVYLAIVNSLRGVQYVFLFLITVASSVLFPTLLKENTSKNAVVQKVVGITIIGLGLIVLVLH